MVVQSEILTISPRELRWWLPQGTKILIFQGELRSGFPPGQQRSGFFLGILIFTTTNNKFSLTWQKFLIATHMDGGSVLTVYFHVVLPLAKPGIASVSIFNFLTAWEEFPWANTVINDDLKRTLPIAISGFFGQHQFTKWGYVFVLSVLSLLPILIVFISCQKFFVEGLTAGSVKG